MIYIKLIKAFFHNNLPNRRTAGILTAFYRQAYQFSNLILYCIRQLMPSFREKFNAIIFKRIMRSRNNYSSIGLHFRCQKRYCRSRHNA